MKIKLPALCAIATLFCATTQAAVTVTRSSTAPTTDADDQYYLPAAVNEATAAMNADGNGNANTAENDALTYIENGRPAKGMWFTTGSNPSGYTLSSISIRTMLLSGYLSNGSWANVVNNSTFDFRFGTYSAGTSTLTPLFNTTSATFTGATINYGGTVGIGEYLTFNLSGEGLATLSPNTTYFFEVSHNGGYMELHNTKANGYAGGAAFIGNNNGTFDADGVVSAPAGGGDYAFHVNLTAISPPLAAGTTTFTPSSPVFAGTPVTLSTTVSGGTTPYGYQWQVDTGSGFGNITDATSSTYNLDTASQGGTAYSYRLVVTDSASATANSTPATLVVNPATPPTLATATTLTPSSVPVGEKVVAVASFTGTPPIFYQWQFSTTNNGTGLTNIPSATSATYTIANAALVNDGYYRLVASNSFGVSNSAWAILQVSPGQLSSFEPFASYTTGTELPSDVPSQPVTGYTGNWTDISFGDAEPFTIAGSLVYGDPAYAAGSGDRIGKNADAAGIDVPNSGRVFRVLDSSLVVNDTTEGVRYLSFLFRTGNENAAAQADIYTVLSLNAANADDDSTRNLAIGIASEASNFNATNYGFMVDNNTAKRSSLGVARDANVHLFVVKFDLSATAASDTVTVWIDPVMAGGEPTGGITFTGSDLQFDRLVISDYASNSGYWDEVRWGDSFNSVTVFHAPTAADLGLGVTAGGSTAATVIGKFAPATDGDGDAVAVSAVTQGTSGTVTFSSTTVTYANTAPAANDSFTYTVSDGKGGTAIRTVSVLISSPEGFNKLSGPTSIGGGNYQLNYLGVPGAKYALEESPDLPATSSSAWYPVITNTASGSGSLSYTVSLSYPLGSFRTRHVP